MNRKEFEKQVMQYVISSDYCFLTSIKRYIFKSITVLHRNGKFVASVDADKENVWGEVNPKEIVEYVKESK